MKILATLDRAGGAITTMSLFPAAFGYPRYKDKLHRARVQRSLSRLSDKPRPLRITVELVHANVLLTVLPEVE